MMHQGKLISKPKSLSSDTDLEEVVTEKNFKAPLNPNNVLSKQGRDVSKNPGLLASSKK